MILNKKYFLNLLNKNFIFEKKPSIAVAVSGGPDSMALLFLLIEWIKTKKGNIIALIINHNMRNNSSEEASSVIKFLNKNNINSKILSVKKSSVKKRSMSEARLNRYKLLFKYCNNNNILHLFIGHHKDDNLETFIYRKISGSDFAGLQSMQISTLWNKISIIRPLLNISKKEIYKYNIKKKIPFLEDPSNVNLNFTRPTIRKFLKNSNNKIREEILNEFKIIKKNQNLYNQMIYEIILRNIVFINTKCIKIIYKDFIKLDKIISEKIIKIIYTFLFHKKTFLRSIKIQKLIDKMFKKNFKLFDLKGMLVEKQRNLLVFSKKNQL